MNDFFVGHEFKLPRYVGRIRAQLAPLLGKPVEPLYDVTRWFLVAGVIACIVAAVPLIMTLIAGWWSP